MANPVSIYTPSAQSVGPLAKIRAQAEELEGVFLNTLMSEMFSFEVELRFLRSLTPFREFSSTFVRLVSISSALAPGYDDMTITTFASNLGNLSNDMLISEKIPKMAMAMKISAVVTGLLTAFL